MQAKIINESGMVSKSGGIVMREFNGTKYVLLVYRGNHKDWSFPKGHVKPGETLEQTAQREIAEECGIQSELVKELPLNEYFNTKSNEMTSCVMYLFKPSTLGLEIESHGDKLEWVALNEATSKVSHPNLKNYFLGIYSLLNG